MITAAIVVSEPVPAVVGTAMSRGSFFLTWNKPLIEFIDLVGFEILAPAPLAQSIGEPPPKAIIASQLFEK